MPAKNTQEGRRTSNYPRIMRSEEAREDGLVAGRGMHLHTA